MSCDHLVCANCAGPVAEGRCPVCRYSREQFGHHSHSKISPNVLLAAVVALITLLVLLPQFNLS